jgi:ADP-ribose pyrophosphatase YjhB (NUDIX family)
MGHNNPVPVVVALLSIRSKDQKHPKLLAIRRGIAPKIGELAFPGGYVNELEDANEAMSRELLEETGLVIEPKHWRPQAIRVTPGNQLLIFMTLGYHGITEKQVHEAFRPNAEAQAYQLVDGTDTLCFPLHDQMLKEWHRLAQLHYAD